MSLDLKQKAIHAGALAALFLVVSLPQVHGVTKKFAGDVNDKCPKYQSKLFHTLIFAVLAIVLMKYVAKSDKSFALMLKYAIYSTLVYFLLSSPEVYKFTDGLIGQYTGALTNGDCPTTTGLAIHTAVYFVVLVLMMGMPADA